MTLDDVLACLRAGEFDALIGEFESETLECKRVPHPLGTDKNIVELVKDVCGLANAEGGYLVFGFTTARDEAHSEDRIDAVLPFPLENFDGARIKSLVAAWTWPHLDVDVEIFRSRGDPSRGVAMIAVPSATDDARPVLVIRTVNTATEKRMDTLVGIFQRSKSHTRHLDARRIHELLVAGRRTEALLRDELALIRTSIADLRPIVVQPEPCIEVAERERRIFDALTAVELASEPYIILTAAPRVPIALSSLFASRESRLAQLVGTPPSIRTGGFDIDIGRQAGIANGRSLRAVEPGSSLLELYRDGYALFFDDSAGLCWATQKWGQGALVINQLALVEKCYLFARFLMEAYDTELGPEDVFDIGARLHVPAASSERFRLQAYRLHGLGPVQDAPSTDLKVDIAVKSGEGPGRIAYRLLAEIYLWFGFRGDQVPYVRENDRAELEIDPDAILDAGRG